VYDPVKRHQAVEKLVVKEGPQGTEKRYWRFRADRWYGGIATADCAGCGLLCKFCWVRDKMLHRPGEGGQFYRPEQVVRNLVSIARKKGFTQLRISGGEPTVGREHLLQVLRGLRGLGMNFILETNGILLGHEADYVEAFTEFPFLHVRVSIKGCTPGDFSKLTGAEPDGFKLQTEALRKLVNAGVSCHPSVMASFSTGEDMGRIRDSLGAIDPRLRDELEVEELILYPHVLQRLERYGIRSYRSYEPDKVPRELV